MGRFCDSDIVKTVKDAIIKCYTYVVKSKMKVVIKDGRNTSKGGTGTIAPPETHYFS